MDEIPERTDAGLSAQIPTMAVVLVIFMAVATAVIVKPATSESADQRTLAKPAAPTPAQPSAVDAPQVDGSGGAVGGRAGPG